MILGEVININTENLNKNYPFDLIKYVDISSVGEGVISSDLDEIRVEEAPSRAKRIVKNNDTILSTVRPQNRSFYFFKEVSENTIASTGFAVLSPKNEKIDGRFLYYYISDKSFTSYLANHEKGAAYPAITTDVIYKKEINLPPLATQKRIASILSAYDDLIENNLKRIKLLEETAQNIYKEWFVNFRFPNYEHTAFDAESGLPVGWEMKGFEDVSLNNNRKRIPLSSTVRENKKGVYPYYGATGIIDYVNEFIFDGRYLLIAEDGTVSDEKGNAYLQLVEGQFWVSNHAHIISGSELPTEFIYLAMKHYPISPLITGAVQLKLSMQNLRRIELLVPENQILDSFMNIANPLIQQVFTLNSQNQKLKEARDILLPRLMNRTIEV